VDEMTDMLCGARANIDKLSKRTPIGSPIKVGKLDEATRAPDGVLPPRHYQLRAAEFP
jgi:hypothetical protein